MTPPDYLDTDDPDVIRWWRRRMPIHDARNEADTLFPAVLDLLQRELPVHGALIGRMRAAVDAARYHGPRGTSRTVMCPWCGDRAMPRGDYGADCWSCGPITRRFR